ncbi:apolipoprotein N-acyltransferase [Sphingomonas jaspsi]|uniref:apolipoprotein N-acyltransferase n=1 Tax=Sphingomonas jaspsi TaxID=392409 RepID=UPI000562A879|nr:apolipoprotein N-acyltransferase [Sphingomonas jaspsi]
MSDPIARRPHALIALAIGLASAAAFQPLAWWPLMPIAIAALALLIDQAPTFRRAMLLGWLFGVGQFTVGLNWIATAFTFQAAMPAWLGWVAVALLSLYLAVYPMMAAGVAWRVGKGRPLALVLALGGAWAIAEWLRSVVFTGFPWNPVGAALIDTPVAAALPYIGTYGLSLLTVIGGGLIWLAIRRNWRSAAIAAVPLALASILPSTTLAPLTQPRPIRIVQPNIGQDVKWDPGFERMALGKLGRLSTPRDDRQELVFWPEAAVTFPLSDNRPEAAPFVQETRRDIATKLSGRDLLMTGGLTLRSSDGETVDRAANSVFILGDDGQFVGRYDKSHLVPYGEYLPMRPILSAIGLSRLAPGDSDFQPGPGPGTLELPEGWGKAGFQVCYEIIFSGRVVDRDNRPDFIFNPSNDAWFGRWGPPQHLAQARMRAAEEGLPIIRSTPTGISALVDAHGEVVDQLPWRKAGIIWSSIPPKAAQVTPFGRLGNVIPNLLGLLFVAAAIAIAGRRRYSAI